MNKQLILWMSAALVIMVIFNYMNGGNTPAQPRTVSDVTRTELFNAYNKAQKNMAGSKITTKEIEKLAKNHTIKDVYYLTDGEHIYAFAIENTLDQYGQEEGSTSNRFIVAPSSKEEASEMIPYLKKSDVVVHTEQIPIQKEGQGFRFPWLLILIIAFIFRAPIIQFFRSIFNRDEEGGGGGQPPNPFTFGNSTAKKQNVGQIKITFDDVAGCEEAKEDAMETVYVLKNPTKYREIGAKMPTGLLMAGPPGTGKTLMAKAIAGEARVPFFTISGSDFVEKFVGVGASRVRDLFKKAKKNAPCIVFIDEIDAVGKSRGNGGSGSNDEREQTLNALLVEMDGFEGNEGIIIIAATNRPETLDAALLRPGRFDRQITIGLPDVRGREEILKVHMKNVKTAGSADKIAAAIARGTPGFSGAELANIVNEAAIFAVKSNKKKADLHHFESAKDKVMMGAARKSMQMSEDERKMTAYHEAGHAIVGEILRKEGHDPAYKVSIMPRGRALGVTMFLPENDKMSHSKKLLSAMISGLYGGRLAEEIIFGKENVSTGASNDIERATGIAKNMVLEWGFTSDEKNEDAPRLYTADGPMGKQIDASPEMLAKLDGKIKEVLNSNYETARKVLDENMDKLHVMSEALLKYETIDVDMIAEIMAGKSFEDLSRPSWWTNAEEAAYQGKNQQDDVVSDATPADADETD